MMVDLPNPLGELSDAQVYESEHGAWLIEGCPLSRE